MKQKIKKGKKYQKLKYFTTAFFFKFYFILKLIHVSEEKKKIEILSCYSSMIQYSLGTSTFYFDKPLFYSDWENNQNCVDMNKPNGITLSYYIKLKWNNEVTSLSCLFYNITNILIVDLSQFNSTLVESTRYLFYNCQSLTSINFNNFISSNIKDMQYMFYNCSSLVSIDLSSFDTSKVTSFSGMFFGCTSLKSINISNFKTRFLIDTSYMFCGCNLFTYIDISNFDMTELSLMFSMFEDCKKLISINFPIIKASNLYRIDSIFKNCESLISVNLSNFVTTNLINMDEMFLNCKSLTSIDLSNFDLTSLTTINYIFKDCLNLEYINLKNILEPNNNEEIYNIFSDTIENIVLCIDKENSPKLAELIVAIKNENCYKIYCGDDWISHQKKLIKDSSICIDSCNNNKDYEYEFNNKCYDSCEYGFFYDKDNPVQKRCKCNLEKCLLCSNVESTKDLCISCNYLYYPLENDPTNIFPYINCYKEPEGYYLDINIYKKCYNTCRACLYEGNYIKHNCLKCKNNYPMELKYEDSLNCYENCSYYYYFDENRNYHCTINLTCPDAYNKLILNNRECINNCSLDNTYKFEYKNICYSECPTGTKEINDNYCQLVCNETNPFLIINTQECREFCDIDLMSRKLCIFEYNMKIEKGNEEENKIQEIKIQNKILENIEKEFISNIYNTSNIDSGNEEVIKFEKMNITLTSTDIEINKFYENISSPIININDCENSLRQTYNISNNQKIYIKKIEVVQEGYKIPFIKYNVYSKLNGTNLIRLNLTGINNKVSIFIPVIISENLDILNTSSGYFNDICYKWATDNNTDIILKDRKEEFIEGKKTTCQNGCDFYNYNYTSKIVHCSCEVKEISDNYADMIIDEKQFFKNFIDINFPININNNIY